MVIALGITPRGEKVLLGFVQTGTENATACAACLRSLVDRGLQIAEGLLVVLDGGKGLRRAVHDVFGEHAQVQRCTWHKRENVVAYLPKASAGALAGEAAAGVSPVHLRGGVRGPPAPPPSGGGRVSTRRSDQDRAC